MGALTEGWHNVVAHAISYVSSCSMSISTASRDPNAGGDWSSSSSISSKVLKNYIIKHNVRGLVVRAVTTLA